jgi:hypothetical protein
MPSDMKWNRSGPSNQLRLRQTKMTSSRNKPRIEMLAEYQT